MTAIKRPLTVTIIAFLFILTGLIGFVYHFMEFSAFNVQVLLILLVRIIAVLGGIFTLFRANWARWLLIAWITFHVIISFWHTTSEIVVHFLFLILTAYCLFQPNAAKYFRKKR